MQKFDEFPAFHATHREIEMPILAVLVKHVSVILPRLGQLFAMGRSRPKSFHRLDTLSL